jgi:group I intron endonuclease
MSIYIVYKTTNNITWQYYVGVHKQKNLKFDGYLGSGKYLKNSIDKYGKENFSRETLFVFNMKKEAYEKEKLIVNEEFINNKNTYNLKEGGCGGSECGRIMSEETKRKIGTANKGKRRSEEFKQKNSDDQKGEKGNFYGRKHTAESIELMKIKRANQVFSEETKKKMSNAAKGRPGNMLGKKHSEEAKKKMREIGKGRPGKRDIIKCPYCNKEGGDNAMKQWHFENCKFKRETNI